MFIFLLTHFNTHFKTLLILIVLSSTKHEKLSLMSLLLFLYCISMTTCGSSSIYSWDKADFRVPGPKRSQPYLTMCMPIVTFGFPDTCEHSKNQLSSSLRYSRLESPYDFKGHTYIFEHIHQELWKYFLVSWICISMQKNQLTTFIHSEIRTSCPFLNTTQLTKNYK